MVFLLSLVAAVVLFDESQRDSELLHFLGQESIAIHTAHKAGLRVL